MVVLLLKEVCCRSAYQAGGEQCVITALAVPLKEELLVDNLDTVEVRSVSLLVLCMCIESPIMRYLHCFTESYVLTNSAQYFGTWSYTDSYYYYCSSSSYSSLSSCSRRRVYSSSYCNSNDQVGLWCATVPSTGKYF